MLGTLRTVLFAPEDLALVKGDPGERRRFLDELLVARQPRWAGVRSDYDRVLKQRNALLKSAAPVLRRGGAPGRDRPAEEAGDGRPRSALHTLDIWDDPPRPVGSQLLYARLRLLRDLGPYLVEGLRRGQRRPVRRPGLVQVAPARGGRRPIAAGEVPGGGGASRRDPCRARGGARPEVERGVSLVGPHRDDVVLTLGELPAKGYASHGESWSFALGLRLAAYELLRHDLGDDPVLILDDVFAELDSGRRERLAGDDRRLRAGADHRRGGRGRAVLARPASSMPCGWGWVTELPDDGPAPAADPGDGVRARAAPSRRAPSAPGEELGDAAEAAAAAAGPGPGGRQGQGAAAGAQADPQAPAGGPGVAAVEGTAATPSCSATRWTGFCSTGGGGWTWRWVRSWAGGPRSSARRSPSTARRSLRDGGADGAGRLHRLGDPDPPAASSILGRARGRRSARAPSASCGSSGPSAPSWSRGPRRSQGPGPRRHLRLTPAPPLREVRSTSPSQGRYAPDPGEVLLTSQDGLNSRAPSGRMPGMYRDPGCRAALPRVHLRGGAGVLPRGALPWSEHAPHATESVSYNMPTFLVGGSRLLHASAWKEHLAIYPLLPAEDLDAEATAALEAHSSGASTLKLLYREEFPTDLVDSVVRAHLARLAAGR